jgi:exonuclease SbcC
MRLLTLTMENITAFRGIHTVDFQKWLGDEDLFAITGPTGAGKSSILTALSLALYGRNYKKSLNSSDFVSQGCSSGSTILEFEHEGKLYRASWSCRVRKKNGDLIKIPQPKRELSCGDVYLDEWAEDILHLSFDQFCKTVILNQGEFSRFLISSFSERREILECLYDGEGLAELSSFQQRKIKDLEHQKDVLTTKIESTQSFTPEQISEANRALVESQKQSQFLDPLGEHLEKLLSLSKSFADKMTRSHYHRAEEKKTNQRVKEFNESYHKLQNETHKLQKKFEHFEISWKDKLPVLQKALALQSEAEGLEKQLQLLRSQLRAGAEEAEKLTNEQSHVQSNLQTWREPLKQWITDLNFERLAGSSLDLPVTNLSQWCEKDLAPLFEAHQNIGQQNLKHWEELARQRENCYKGHKLASESLFVATKELAQTEKSLKIASQKFSLLNTQKENLELRLTNQQLALALEKLREKASKEGQCPLCHQSVESLPPTEQSREGDCKTWMRQLEVLTSDWEVAQKDHEQWRVKKDLVCEKLQTLQKEADNKKSELKASDHSLETFAKKQNFGDPSDFEQGLKNQLKLWQRFCLGAEKIDQAYQRNKSLEQQIETKKQNSAELNNKLHNLEVKKESLQKEILRICPSTRPLEELELGQNTLDQLRSEWESSQKRLQTSQQQLTEYRSACEHHQLEALRVDSELKNEKEIWQTTLDRLKIACSQISNSPLPNPLIETLSLESPTELLELKAHWNSARENNQKILSDAQALLKLAQQKESDLIQWRQELDELTGLYQRQATLGQVLGKNDFRNYALALIERQLIEMTNAELRSLCDGRYQLVQRPNKFGSEFFIADSWRGGLERKISTLSGGETFLVSLTMALGLAEMTRGQTEINSFFIDEGFGSLDRDSIEDVVEVLNALRNRGKQIGIISHVEELTESLPITINVLKSRQGSSSLQCLH